ncbi:hypothetical protein QFW77_10625 [Luteimonas sp. RD2P54]|uniref:Lipoprotein n=1 Tax=Luteimonas endophytica TaxID=3042023 RepID=A0ABT6J9D5_9GAMM|nr:hypothetical protein [Luteimonas endophytica]MDH5823440.1 hypothetical protein [Luteimonas endophytica]
MPADRAAHGPIAAGWLLAGLLAGCSAGDASRPEAIGAPRATASADAPAPAGDVLLDLRVPASGFEATAEETRRVVAAVYGDGAPGDLTPTSRVEGAFTAAGARQTAYTLRRGGAMTGPERAPTMLAVLDADGRVAAQFVVDHDRIAAAADIQGDGTDELFLATDGYQMGQAYTGLELVSLAGGQRRSLAEYPQAWLDACANPVGERHVEAAVIVRGANRPELRRYRAGCGGDQPPAVEAYRPVGAQAPA